MADPSSPASPTADELAAALLRSREMEASRNRGLVQIKDQRNLMVEIAKLSRDIGVQFNVHSENIGSAVTEMSKLDKLNAIISARTKENNSLEYSYMQDMKKHHDDIIIEKSIIADIEKNISKLREAGAPLLDAEGRNIDQLKAKLTEVKGKMGDRVELTETNLKLVAKEIELNRTLIEQQEKLAARERVKESMSEKFFGSMTQNLAKSDFAKAMGLDKVIGNLSGPVKAGLNAAFKIVEFGIATFLKFDDALFALRKNFGLMRDQNLEIEQTAKKIAKEYANIGITIEGSVAAITELGNSFGLSSSASKEIITNVAALNIQLGISEKTSVGFLKSISGISGKNVKEASEGMLGFAQSMSAAAGTNLNEVMGDISSSSDAVRSTFRGNTIELIKATIEARRFGLSLETMGKTSENLLQFNSSVNSEMEASVLLGKNINLMEARKAAFAGDYKKQQEEILKVTKSVGDFDKLNAMQKTALAKATGLTVTELQTMLQREKEIDYIKSSGTPQQKAMLAQYEKYRNLQEGEVKDLGKQGEERMKKENHQTRMATLQQQFNQLMMDLAGPIIDIMEPLMSIATVILPVIIKGMRVLVGVATISGGLIFVTGLVTALTNTGKILGNLPRMWNAFSGSLKGGNTILESIMAISKAASRVAGEAGTLGKIFAFVFKPIVYFGNIITKLFNTMAGPISSFSAGILKTFPFLGSIKALLAPIMKFAGPIGIVITVVQALMSLVGTFKSAFKDFSDGKFLSGTLKLLTALPKAIIDVTLGAVYDLFRMILGWFGLDLPEGIWAGLESMFGGLFDAISSPFKKAFDLIMGLFAGDSLGSGLIDGIKLVGNTILDFLVWPYKMALNFIGGLFGIDSLGTDLVEGIKSVGSSILDFLILPYKTAFDWIMNLFGGDSLGTDLVEGIKSVGSMIFDVLAYPYKMALNFIGDLFGIDSLGSSLIDGIKSVGSMIFDVLVYPYKTAFDWIMGFFGGNSPSELGLRLLDGITSVGSMIFDVLISPFKLAFDVIRSIFKKGFDFIMNLPGVRFIKSIVGSIGSFFKGSSTPKETTVNPPLSVNPPSSENKTAKNSDEELNSDEGHQTDNQPILDKLDELINLMKSGGIAINLDGRKVSETLAYASR